jgi:hypothetical protein
VFHSDIVIKYEKGSGGGGDDDMLMMIMTSVVVCVRIGTQTRPIGTVVFVAPIYVWFYQSILFYATIDISDASVSCTL